MINDLTVVDEAQLLNAQARLDCGVRELGLSLSPQQIQACLMHVLMLKRWNRTHNLTAVSNLNDMVVLHTLDTLSVLPYLYKVGEMKTGQRVLDVGTGGGFPGIPLSIARTDIAVTLLDSNHKKTSFVRACVARLGLSNCDIVTSRVEQFQVKDAFDVVTLRALTHPVKAMDWSAHLLRPGGCLVLMLGKALDRREFDHEMYELTALEPIRVPKLSAARHVALVIRR